MFNPIKNKTVIVMTAITLLISVITIYKKTFYHPAQETKVPLYDIKVYQPDSSGWGYRIYSKGNLYIQQEYIPAIAGQHRFKSKLDAEKTAGLVMKKLLNGESPTVSKSELHQLGIE